MEAARLEADLVTAEKTLQAA